MGEVDSCQVVGTMGTGLAWRQRFYSRCSGGHQGIVLGGRWMDGLLGLDAGCWQEAGEAWIKVIAMKTAGSKWLQITFWQ